MAQIKFKKIQYQDLNSRQKESFNFHKVAAVLTDYGFTSIRITDDWESADFIAAHVDGSSFLKVQLKGRLTFSKSTSARISGLLSATVQTSIFIHMTSF